jgi:hypothetical protein
LLHNLLRITGVFNPWPTRLRDYPWQLSYSTSSHAAGGQPVDILHHFYLPVLSRATGYDRVAGYFRSSSLAMASQGFSAFVAQGGKARMVVGADLDADDVAAILSGDEARLSAGLNAALDQPAPWPEAEQRGVALLAWMIAQGCLEIRVALRVHTATGEPLTGDSSLDGYVHEKWAIFRDAAGDRLYATGSFNESKTALILNAENIDVHRDWTRCLLLATATPMQLDPVEVADLIRLTRRVGHFQFDPSLTNAYYTLLGKLGSEQRLDAAEWALLHRAVKAVEGQDPLLWRYVQTAVIDDFSRFDVENWLESGQPPMGGEDGIRRLEVEIAGTEARLVGYAVRDCPSAGPDPIRFVHGWQDLNGLSPDETQAIDEVSAEQVRVRLAALARRRSERIKGVGRIETLNEQTARGHLLLTYLVAQRSMQGRRRTGSGADLFWHELANLENADADRPSIRIKPIPVKLIRRFPAGRFETVLLNVGEDGYVDAPRILLDCAFDAAARLADSLRVKKDELSTDDMIAGVLHGKGSQRLITGMFLHPGVRMIRDAVAVDAHGNSGGSGPQCLGRPRGNPQQRPGSGNMTTRANLTSAGSFHLLHPRQLPGQAYRLQIIMRLRKRPGVLAQTLPGRRVIEQRADFVSETCHIEEIDQAPGLVVPDGLMQRLGVARHNGAAHAHGFQQAPGEYEGIGQIDMHGRQLEQRDEVLVRDMAEEMHPHPVGITDLRADFGNEDVLPRLAILWPRAVAHIIAADDQYLGVGAALQDLRQRAHEAVVAPVRFEVTVDEGDDLILFRQGAVATER